MTCWTSRVSRSLSVSIRLANRFTASGSSAASEHRLGQQPDRADRGLQLVAHVGHEVAAYRLDAALAGAVLDQRQHQPRAQRGHPGGDVAGRAAAARASRARSRGSARRDGPGAPGRPARRRPARCRAPGPSAYAGAEAFRTVSLSSTTTALLRSTESTVGHAGRDGGLLDRGQVPLLAVADVPGQHARRRRRPPRSARRGTPASSDPRARIVRRRPAGFRPGDGGFATFIPRSRPAPRLVTCGRLGSGHA